MAKFIVQFEDIGYSSNPNLADARLNDWEAEGFTDQAVSEGTLPEGVCAVVGGYLSADDPTDEREDETKYFACIKLLIEAEDEEEAEQFPPPVELLNQMVETMVSAVTDDGSMPLSLEGNWEILETIVEE